MSKVTIHIYTRPTKKICVYPSETCKRDICISIRDLYKRHMYICKRPIKETCESPHVPCTMSMVTIHVYTRPTKKICVYPSETCTRDICISIRDLYKRHMYICKRPIKETCKWPHVPCTTSMVTIHVYTWLTKKKIVYVSETCKRDICKSIRDLYKRHMYIYKRPIKETCKSAHVLCTMSKVTIHVYTRPTKKICVYPSETCKRDIFICIRDLYKRHRYIYKRPVKETCESPHEVCKLSKATIHVCMWQTKKIMYMNQRPVKETYVYL